jgi:transcriptional regulator with XRE-family HTH domain
MARYFRTSTLMAAALKELRIGGNQTQAMVACKSGKSQNAYCKIENGYTELTLDAFIAICMAMGHSPTHVMQQIEVHMSWLCSQGWRVAVLKSQDCELAAFVEMYFMVENAEALNRVMCLEQDRVKLVGGWKPNYHIPAVLRFATEEKFRRAVDTFKAEYQ